MIDSGKLDVVIRDGRMVVKLPASVLFDSGKAELSRDGELALMEVAIALRDFENRKFLVEGHTDNRPLESTAATSRFRNNWDLSAGVKFVGITVVVTAIALMTYQLFVRYTPIGTLLNGKRTRPTRESRTGSAIP